MHRLTKILGLTSFAALAALAFSATAAQANYLLLLEGESVQLLNLSVLDLLILVKSENGLDLHCKNGEGTKHVALIGGGTGISTSTSITWIDCEWTGSESTCTINDEGEGLVNVSGNGSLTMSGPSEYGITLSSSELATIYTEGVFCTIPEEEVISGTIGAELLNALEDSKVKLSHHEALDANLGNSQITELSGEAHIRDENPDATFGVHLVEL